MKKISMAYTSPAMGEGKTQTRRSIQVQYRDTQKVRGRKTYFIQPDDVGVRCLKDRKDGEVICFESAMGRIMEQDVGKMMQKVGDFWYVENQEQFNERKEKYSQQKKEEILKGFIKSDSVVYREAVNRKKGL